MKVDEPAQTTHLRDLGVASGRPPLELTPGRSAGHPGEGGLAGQLGDGPGLGDGLIPGETRFADHHLGHPVVPRALALVELRAAAALPGIPQPHDLDVARPWHEHE
ncbi:hypothetical protein [Lapillicoccus sp.]|uniref:hypothetical protein n=1 Tax=Lapillicoccus sp. TaxID=1909287 RepID=UPI003983B649